LAGYYVRNGVGKRFWKATTSETGRGSGFGRLVRAKRRADAVSAG
jgi:hypothetical protein